MTPEQREQMEKQVEQLTCFLDSCYAGMAQNVRIIWDYTHGKDKLGRETKESTVEYWRDKHGKHTEVTLGVGDAYYGSSTLAFMLYEHAFHMRERLRDKLDEKRMNREYADLADKW